MSGSERPHNPMDHIASPIATIKSNGGGQSGPHPSARCRVMSRFDLSRSSWGTQESLRSGSLSLMTAIGAQGTSPISFTPLMLAWTANTSSPFNHCPVFGVPRRRSIRCANFSRTWTVSRTGMRAIGRVVPCSCLLFCGRWYRRYWTAYASGLKMVIPSRIDWRFEGQRAPVQNSCLSAIANRDSCRPGDDVGAAWRSSPPEQCGSIVCHIDGQEWSWKIRSHKLAQIAPVATKV